MSGIDYSRWDHLEVSDGDSNVETLEEAARRERAQLAGFVARRPCPSEEAIVRWLSAATRSAEEGGTEAPLGTFPGALASMAWRGEDVLAWFHYPSFSKLWQAPRHGQEEARQRQLEVGEELRHRGGVPCMQLHYYMLNYAMCGEDFLRGVFKPRAAYGYVNQIERAWDGIGDWLA